MSSVENVPITSEVGTKRQLPRIYDADPLLGVEGQQPRGVRSAWRARRPMTHKIAQIGIDTFRITWSGSRGTYPLVCQTTRSFDFANQQWLSLVSRPPWDCQAAPTGISKTLYNPRKPAPCHKCTAALRAYVRAARKLWRKVQLCLRIKASCFERHAEIALACRTESRLDHRHLGRLENLRRSRDSTTIQVGCLTRC